MSANEIGPGTPCVAGGCFSEASTSIESTKQPKWNIFGEPSLRSSFPGVSLVAAR
jgi:hypothetical protein